METLDQKDGLINGAYDMSVKLPIFEGPLDLLLFLIRKNEIDIYDIPIEHITKQYVGILRSMENLSLDIAGEFFVMAATLMYIKSRMLLPVDERVIQDNSEDDADVDPRWELVEQLLEYKKVKNSAYVLEDMIKARQDCLSRLFVAKSDGDVERPLKNSDRIELWNIFNNVLRRLAEKLVEGEIVGEQVSVSDRMEYLLNHEREDFTFSSLFENVKVSIPLMIATFLAVLELTRLRRLEITQVGVFDEIFLKKLPEVNGGIVEGINEIK